MAAQSVRINCLSTRIELLFVFIQFQLLRNRLCLNYMNKLHSNRAHSSAQIGKNVPSNEQLGENGIENMARR